MLGCGVLHYWTGSIRNGKGIHCGSGTKLSQPSMSLLQKSVGDDTKVHSATFVTAAHLYTR